MNEDPIRDILEYLTESICTGYVIVATTTNAQLGETFYIKSMETQIASTTIGLLETASEAEKHRVAVMLTRGQLDD